MSSFTSYSLRNVCLCSRHNSTWRCIFIGETTIVYQTSCCITGNYRIPFSTWKPFLTSHPIILPISTLDSSAKNLPKAKSTFWNFWKFPFGRMVLIPRCLWICGVSDLSASQQNHTSRNQKHPRAAWQIPNNGLLIDSTKIEFQIHPKKLRFPNFQTSILGCSDRSSTKDLSIPSECKPLIGDC